MIEETRRGLARRKPRHRDALVSCCPSNELAQNSVILPDVKTSREEPQLQKRRDTGDLVKFIGVIGIIAVISIAVGAALIGSSGVAAGFERAPDGGNGALIKEKPGSHGTANREKKATAMVSTIKGDRPANQFGAGAIIVKPRQAQKNGHS